MQVLRSDKGENLVIFDRIKRKTRAWRIGRWFYYFIWFIPAIGTLLSGLYIRAVENQWVSVYDVFVLFVCFSIFSFIFNLVFKAFLYGPVGDLLSYTDLILTVDEKCLAQTGIVRGSHVRAVQGVATRVEIPYANITKMVWNPVLERIEIYGQNIYLKKYYQAHTGWEFKCIRHFAANDNLFRLYRMYPHFNEMVSLLEQLSGQKVEGYIPGEFIANGKPGYMSSLHGAKSADGDKSLLSKVGYIGEKFMLYPASAVLSNAIAMVADHEAKKMVCPVCEKKAFMKSRYNDFGVCVNCGCRRDA